MASVLPLRQFAYAVLATLAAFGAWTTSFQSYDGGWILWGSVGLFLVLVLVDLFVTSRVLAGPEPAA